MALPSVYGALNFEGLDSKNASFNIAASVVEGDVLGASATAGTLGFGSDGGELVGYLKNMDADRVGNVALVGSGEIVTAVRTGTINSSNAGWTMLAVDGAGKVKAGTNTRTFYVIGQQTVSSVTYITFIL
jgi:hypothetical protein